MPVDNDFDRAVQEFLRAGLHRRRGMSEEAYVAECRRVWDACLTSDEAPFKVLLDPLVTPGELIAALPPQDYLDRRTEDLLERAVSARGNDITCKALGLARPDLSMSDQGGSTEPEHEPAVPEVRLYAVALFDVLGFSASLEATRIESILALYERLIAEAVTREAMRVTGMVRLNDRESASTVFALPVSHTHFSDTIILWVPLVQHFIRPFIARCADLVCDALKLDVPLRGAISVGPAVLHKSSGTFLGAPIVEAARLEQAQEWVGVSLGLSTLAHDVAREFDPNLVVPYDAPVKPKRRHLVSGAALDWPRRFVERHRADPADALRANNKVPAFTRYYDNAAAFVKFSDQLRLRREGMQPINIGELAAAALDARRAGARLDDEQRAVLRDLRSAGGDAEAAARFIEEFAAGATPKVPDTKSSALGRRLRKLRVASEGEAKLFNLTATGISVLDARSGGRALSEETEKDLQELEAFSGQTRRVASFLRGLAKGDSAPVPARIPSEMRKFLRDLHSWAEGRVPTGAVQHLAEQCVHIRSRGAGAELSDHDAAMLRLVQASAEPWSSVATFLRSIANPASNPEVPNGLPTRISRMLVRVRQAARTAGVQSPCILEIMSVGTGDPPTGIDLFDLVRQVGASRNGGLGVTDELEIEISRFEKAAPERRGVGQILRTIARGESAQDVPRLPIALRQFVAQVLALVDGSAIPLDAEVVGWAAVRIRHGGGAKMGDCAAFALRMMLSAGGELQRLAEYFASLAGGGPAGPPPRFVSEGLSTIAAEMRCLAEPAVGGFRTALVRREPASGPDET